LGYYYAKVYKKRLISFKKEKKNFQYNFNWQAIPTIKSDKTVHLTSNIPNESDDGMHSFRSIRGLLFDKELTYPEIKNVFS